MVANRIQPLEEVEIIGKEKVRDLISFTDLYYCKDMADERNKNCNFYGSVNQ